jgi:hypothetical protein
MLAKKPLTVSERHARFVYPPFTINVAGTVKWGPMMIIGTHVVLYSANAEADRIFIRDVVGFGSVDAGEGWLIFALPPSELAVHPGNSGGSTELFLLCDDLEPEIARLAALGAVCTPPTDAGWGRLTYVSLPSGAQLGLYQPRHARPSRAPSAPY